MKRVVIAALPRELRRLTRTWRRVPAERDGIEVWAQDDVLAVSGGMGRERVTMAFEAGVAAAGDELSEVISFGLAGACSIDMRIGEAFWCGTVVDARSGERYGAGGPVLVTSGQIAGVIEKRRLRESYGALLVDMEAATLARLAEARGIRFRALKGISDGPEMTLEGVERFATNEGGFRDGMFALHVALRPRMWRGAMELGRASASALKYGTEMLERALREGEGDVS